MTPTSAGLAADETARCREAIRLLFTAGDLPPGELIERMDAVEEQVVSVRDSLIARSRAASSGGSPPAESLKRINLCLTLVASVEYPGSLDRPRVGEARELLEQLVGKGVSKARG